jgi:hypothetical protein
MNIGNRGPKQALWALLLLAFALAACSTAHDEVTGSTTNSTSDLMPARQTHDQKVIVTPSTNLSNNEQVELRVTGFGIGGKVLAIRVC